MKKRIAFYIDTFNKGGTEKATLDLLNNLNTDKYDITLIRFFPEGEYNKYLKSEIKNKVRYPLMLLVRKSERASYWVAWLGRKIFAKMPGKLAHKLLIGDKYDLEVACGFHYPTYFISYSKYAKKISWVHMDYTIDKSTIGNFSKEEGQEFFGGMDKIVCVSHECEDKFNQKFDMPNKTKTLYNILDVTSLEKKAKCACEMKKEKDPIVVAVGRLTWQKGFDRLLKVHKRLIDNGLTHKLYIIGEGEDKEQLDKYICDNNMMETVTLLGYKQNPYPYIKNADVFVCSSRHESFSYVVAESIVLGTPVISTDCAGPNELLNHGEYGMIVKNSEDGLYQGMETMLSDKKVRELYLLKTNERKDFFETKNSVLKWEALIDQLLEA